MKSLYIILLLLGFSLSGSAQLVIPTDIIPLPGDFFLTHNVQNAEAINVGDSGLNKVWDLTNVQYVNSNYYFHETMAANATPYAAQFSGSNYADKYYPSDEPSYVTYRYYNRVDSTLDYYLNGMKSTVLTQVYNNPELLTHFPFGFNNVVTDDYCFTSNGLSVTTNYCGHATLQFDGTGLLMLPYGNYSSVYRFKYYSESVEAGAPNDTIRDTKYYWYKSGIRNALVVYDSFESTNGNTFVTATLLSASSANSVNDVESIVDVNVYPNPASEYLSVDVSPFINSNAIMTLTSVDGRVVKKLDVINSTLQKIDLRDVAQGVYTLLISDDSKVTRKMIVKN